MTPISTTPYDATETAVFADVRRDGVQWIVRNDVSADLLTDTGLPVAHWLADGTATIIKSGKHRTVYRVERPAGRFFLKHYRVPDWKALLQNVVRPSKAELEWRAIARIHEAGIPTVAPVAMGLRKRGPIVTDSFLITQAIDNVETLQEFVERSAAQRQDVSPFVRQQLAGQLGHLVARLHNHGLLHRDLHAGNLLVRVDANEAVRMWLIDLHAVAKRRRLTPPQWAETHALLHNFVVRYTTAADRLRYITRWWSQLRECVADDRREKRRSLQVIEAACNRWSARACEKADRKWFDGHRKLVIVESHGTHCRSVAEWGSEAIRELVAAANRTAETNELSLEQVGDHWRALLADHALSDTARVQIWTERRETQSNGNHSFRWLGRERHWSNARTIWEMGHALLRRGIATSHPLLFAEQTTSAGRIDVVVTESEAAEVAKPTTQSPELIRQAAKLLRRLHDHGFLHTRLAPQSFRMQQADHADECHVVLAGITAVRPVSQVSREQAISQFARLNEESDKQSIPYANRLRFLLSYLDRRQRGDWKTWWQAVRQAVQHHEQPDGLLKTQRTTRRGFLRAALTTAAVFAGCHTPKHQQSLVLPSHHSVRSGQLLVFSNRKLPRDHAVVQDLLQLRKHVTVTLQLPAQREDVIVYIFSTEKEYRDYLNTVYPGLPNRRAYFVGTKSELAVYTYWGEKIQEDLRHEYTHGLLHASLKTVPLWIDEGLAEYFEVGGPRPGLANSDYARRLADSLSNGWKPDLQELEKLEEFSRMQHIHYQESWAWVHYLVHSSDGTRQILLDYLKDLRTSRRPQPLSERLQRYQPAYRDRLLAHIATLQGPGLLTDQFVRPAMNSESGQSFSPR